MSKTSLFEVFWTQNDMKTDH